MTNLKSLDVRTQLPVTMTRMLLRRRRQFAVAVFSELDECGVCGGDGIAEGACDCNGNGPEAGYDCDGNCIADANNDGLCDIGGCTILEACNYNPLANLLVPEDCIFPVAEGYDCYEVVEGCTDASAVNYNPFATIDDGSCVMVVDRLHDSKCLHLRPQRDHHGLLDVCVRLL